MEGKCVVGTDGERVSICNWLRRVTAGEYSAGIGCYALCVCVVRAALREVVELSG